MDNKQIDILIERPRVVRITTKEEDTYVYFYPLTLGKSYLIDSLVKLLQANNERLATMPSLEMLRVVRDKRDIILRILALHASQGKRQVYDEELQSLLCSTLGTLADDELASLFLSVQASGAESPMVLMNRLGIDKKQQQMAKIQKAKDDHSSVVLGGATIYGQLIDAAAERYGWTYDYILWDISMINLQLMLADKVDSVYLSKEERKKAHIYDDKEVINADDPRNADRIRQLLSNS